MNPLRYVVEAPETNYLTGTRVLAGLYTRLDLARTLESIYRSEDSYALARSIYLQNRRFELRGGGSEAPFDAAPTDGAAAAGDPVLDPYFDPYAQ
jgi:phospholipid-binding lipoprotein MlaA